MKYKTLNRDDFKRLPNDNYAVFGSVSDELEVYKADAHDRCYLLIYHKERKVWHWESWTTCGTIKLGSISPGRRFWYRDQAFLAAYMDYLKAQEESANIKGVPANG